MAALFQSTLPRRERQKSHITIFSGKYFNPRSREGSDYFKRIIASRNLDFNPRSREGSDGDIANYLHGIKIFQSTLPRRERHSQPFPSSYILYFNPRSREGSDCFAFYVTKYL